MTYDPGSDVIEVVRHPSRSAAATTYRIFGETRERGNEGLMLKNPESAYTPGRRGLSWLKLKRPLATLDCVVTAVERESNARCRRREVHMAQYVRDRLVIAVQLEREVGARAGDAV